VVYKVHHKSHIDKQMCIAMTAFIPHNNDIMAGGVSSQIGLYRVGRMEEAKKDSFKRVYKKNGTYTYPRTMSNRLREKGKEYFQPMELTGAVCGTPKHPKVSKLDTYLEHFLPAMDEKAREISTKNVFKKVVMVKHEDNAGLNQNKKYVKRLRYEFDRRGWVRKNQSPNSPDENMCDFVTFPSMSKRVSNEQGVQFGARYMNPEQLNRIVTDTFWSNNMLTAISKGFVGHHQVACAILDNNGGNEFLTSKGGCHFGVRRVFLENETGDGVIAVDIVNDDGVETSMTQQFVDEREREGLKYNVPDVGSFTEKHLEECQLDVIMEYLDHERASNCERGRKVLGVLQEDILMSNNDIDDVSNDGR
jgi:hypothetical protein